MVQAMINTAINTSKQQEHQQLASLLQHHFQQQKDDISKEFEQRMNRYKDETERRITEQIAALRDELKAEMETERTKLVSKLKEKFNTQQVKVSEVFNMFTGKLESTMEAVDTMWNAMYPADGIEIAEEQRQLDEATNAQQAAKYDYESTNYMEQSDLLQLTQDQSMIVMNETLARDEDDGEQEIEFTTKKLMKLQRP